MPRNLRAILTVNHKQRRLAAVGSRRLGARKTRGIHEPVRRWGQCCVDMYVAQVYPQRWGHQLADDVFVEYCGCAHSGACKRSPKDAFFTAADQKHLEGADALHIGEPYAMVLIEPSEMCMLSIRWILHE